MKTMTLDSDTHCPVTCHIRKSWTWHMPTILFFCKRKKCKKTRL